jgi:hypothetical protein
MANGTPTSSIELIGLQSQVEGVRSELVSTNNGLIGIANLIRTDGAQDQQRLLDERRDQQLLSERKIRMGQEEALERQVSASFVEPVNKLERNLSSTFGNIQKALNFLFVGAVSGVFLKGLGKAVDLGKSTLAGVGSLLTNIFGAIGSGLGTIKNGFGSVLKSIGGVVDDISKGILSLAKSPFKAIADAFSKLLGKGTPTPTPTPTPRPTTTSPGGGGALRSLQRFLGPITRLASGFGAVSSAMEGDYVGAGVYGAAALLPNPLTGSAALAYSFFGDQIKEGLSNITNQFGNFDFQGLSIPNLFGMNDGETNLDASSASAGSAGEVAAPVTSTTTSAAQPAGPQRLQVIPFRSDQSQVQTPPAQQRNLQPPAEPAPDVVYLQSGNQQESTVASSGGGTLTDVPLIPSANPDNFYTLYAQLNYNVVI